MPSLLDIRRRIRAVKSTQQITKAMKMVAASRLRRAQERIQQARPFANEMLRVLNSLATRVDSAAAPAARRAEGAARRRQGAALRHYRGSRPVRQLQHQRDQGRGDLHRRESREGGRARADRPARTDYFARRGFEVRYEQVNLFQALQFARAAHRPGRGRGLHDRPGRQRLPGLQRVPLRHVAAHCGRAAAADSAARYRSADGGGPERRCARWLTTSMSRRRRSCSRR